MLLKENKRVEANGRGGFIERIESLRKI